MADYEMNGARKAAVLLVQMGRERSAQVLKQLREGEVEALMAEVARLEDVEATTVDEVFAEFSDLARARKFVTQGGLTFARDMLEASVGSDRAQEIINRLAASMVEMPFQFLRRTDPTQVVSFLADEHPQTIALVLSHLPSAAAATVLSALPADLQAEVAHRIAVMEQTTPEAVRTVEAILQRKTAAVLTAGEMDRVGGLEPLVDIINRADRATERQILEGLERRSPELAEQVRAQMFIFEDITTLDDRSVQLLLRQVDMKEMAAALKGVKAEVRDKILSNMSERAGQNLVDEIETMGPVRITAVEEAQAAVVRAIRQLEESGQLTIARGDGDEFVV